MSDEQLQQLVGQISRDVFKSDFKHQAYFNKRLRTTGGRYLLSDHNIEINPKMLTEHDFNTLVGVIKHELCHYHLHLKGRGYRHRDRAFKQLLQQVKGSRYAPHSRKPRKKLCYRCLECGQEYLRFRKIDTKRYVCSRCQGHLILIRKDK